MRRRFAFLLLSTILSPRGADAQTAASPDQAPSEQTPSKPRSWQFMQDGVVFATFNNEGSPRGETDFHSENWYMGMGMHRLGPGTITLTGMFSLEPMTVGAAGYSEIFQLGEAYNKLENVDRQHPHNLFMQLAAIWRVPIGDRSGFTIAAAPVGEPALGPVAYMHRASSFENPIAPISHHTFDSTHISQGVTTVALDHGPWTAEASAFHGREPDQHRWDLATHGLDSFSARVWYRPSAAWIVQVSHGFLRQPEELEPGNQRRTSASVSWLHQRGSNFIAVTSMYGRIGRTYTELNATVSEATAHFGRISLYGRAETLQIETEHLLFPLVVHKPHPGELVNWLGVYTVGGVRDLWSHAGFDLGVGGDAVFYSVPGLLQLQYGPHPVSFHIFARLRPPSPRMGRMWNRTMADPMRDQTGMGGMPGMPGMDMSHPD